MYVMYVHYASFYVYLLRLKCSLYDNQYRLISVPCAWYKRIKRRINLSPAHGTNESNVRLNRILCWMKIERKGAKTQRYFYFSES